MISMGKNLHLRVVAEGVETQEQLAYLQARECPFGQGYYFSKPLSADKAADKLRGGPLELQAKGEALGIGTTS